MMAEQAWRQRELLLALVVVVEGEEVVVMMALDHLMVADAVEVEAAELCKERET